MDVDGEQRVSPFSLSRWGPANPHTTQMPGSITLIVRRYPNGTVTPRVHNLKPGETVMFVCSGYCGFDEASSTHVVPRGSGFLVPMVLGSA